MTAINIYYRSWSISFYLCVYIIECRLRPSAAAAAAAVRLDLV